MKVESVYKSLHAFHCLIVSYLNQTEHERMSSQISKSNPKARRHSYCWPLFYIRNACYEIFHWVFVMLWQLEGLVLLSGCSGTGADISDSSDLLSSLSVFFLLTFHGPLWVDKNYWKFAPSKRAVYSTSAKLLTWVTTILHWNPPDKTPIIYSCSKVTPSPGHLSHLIRITSYQTSAIIRSICG